MTQASVNSAAVHDDTIIHIIERDHVAFTCIFIAASDIPHIFFAHITRTSALPTRPRVLCVFSVFCPCLLSDLVCSAGCPPSFFLSLQLLLHHGPSPSPLPLPPFSARPHPRPRPRPHLRAMHLHYSLYFPPSLSLPLHRPPLSIPNY